MRAGTRRGHKRRDLVMLRLMVRLHWCVSWAAYWLRWRWLEDWALDASVRRIERHDREVSARRPGMAKEAGVPDGQ